MMQLICTQRIEQNVTGGTTESAFPQTEALLELPEYKESLKYVGSSKNMEKYESMMDFLFCELNPYPWRNRCFKYYKNRKVRLVDHKDVTPEWCAEYDLRMCVALELAVAMQQQNVKMPWSAYDSQFSKIIKAA